MKYDVASKRLADLGVESLLSRFLQIEVEDSQLIEELPQETATLRSSDFPILVKDKSKNELIVLLEFQTWWKSDLPLRVGEYVLRFKRKYHLPVKPLVFLFKKHSSATDFYDDGVISVRYRLVKMWQVEGKELLESEDLYLLPLVAVANSGKDEIFEAERRIYDSRLEREVKADLLTILTIFAGLKGEKITEELLKRRREIMIESVAYDLIKEEGIREGIQKGIKKGTLETAERMVLEVLEERFKIVPVRLVEKVRTIVSDVVLSGLLRQAVRCDSLEEFEGVLERAIS